MDYEREMFQNRQVRRETLLPYGFEQHEDTYRISRAMHAEGMRMEVIIRSDGSLQGRVMDTAFGEEYTNFRIESTLGGFAGKIKEEYLAFLTDIREHCFENCAFYGAQANRIARRIEARYHDAPAFLWEKTPDCAVFKHSGNERWYAIFMGVAGDKVNVNAEKVSIINVKLSEAKIKELCAREGFAPAYHMNKTHWITIILNDTVSDDEIMAYVDASYACTEKLREWLIPANPKYYDVIAAFERCDTITWKQSSRFMEVGQAVYLYVGLPYSAILYKCIITETDLAPDAEEHKNKAVKRMRIKRVATYREDQYPLSLLKRCGIKSVRGARSMNEQLSRIINEEE